MAAQSRMSLFSYHVRRITVLTLALLFFFTFLRVIFPGNEFVILDRNQQLKEIARLIQSSGNNAKTWGGRRGCKHPSLEVGSPEMMKFVKYQPPIECTGDEDWVKVTGSTAQITAEAKKKYGDIECSFTDINRANDYVSRMGIVTTTHTEYNMESSDFVRVRCASDSGKKWTSILAGARYDQDVLDRTGWNLVPRDGLKLNVLMFGFDSLSRNTFIRKLPRSYNYLKDTLNAYVLQGYNIVGDGTPQALIPMLTGKTELELPDTRRRMGEKASYVNVYPFVWNEFKKNGYVTGFMEDTPSVGIFTYRLKGFKEVPTDHYMRTFFVAAEPDYKTFSNLCIGSIPRHKIMLDYAKHMYTVYKERPKFIFGFHGEISHDQYNLVGGADRDLEEWLRWFKEQGHLNNTLLIFMSDHGHRFAEIRNTQQGKLEERLPWFSLVVPPWFEQVYPEAAEALRHNTEVLTTPFDIHETLRSVLHYAGPHHKSDLGKRALSLFHKIPVERTCADAYIEPHWCACLDWEKIDVSDSIVQKGAQAFIDFINNYNRQYSELCAHMSLSKVDWAARLIPSTALREFQQSADVDGFVPKMGGSLDITMATYQIKLTTLPGHAIFEVSTSYYIDKDEFLFKIEDVSRINQYGSQARCIENSQEQLRKFCYCSGS